MGKFLIFPQYPITLFEDRKYESDVIITVHNGARILHARSSHFQLPRKLQSV